MLSFVLFVFANILIFFLLTHLGRNFSVCHAKMTSSATARPETPVYLKSQLKWLHFLLAGLMIFVVFSKQILGEWLRPEAHLLLLACMTMITGVKGSTFMYCLGEEIECEEGEEGDSNVSNEDLGPVLTAADAARMPIMGSCVLFGLFCVYKYLGQDMIKMVFTLYVVFMCAVGLGANISDFVDMLRRKEVKPLIRIEYLDLDITIVDIAGYCLSGVLGYYYILTKDDYEANWVINNLFGVSFCLLGMKQVNISTYRAGCIMLCGLFVYDVFWVFLSKPLIGSNVMVTVAKGVKAPIKLMFPREGKGMLYNATNVGLIPSQRTVLNGVSIDKYNSSELLGCKLTCIHTDTCIGMEWDSMNVDALDSSACLLFSEASGALVAASNDAVQWLTKGTKFMPSMLGLGDIVVPGVFLSLLAKFDVTLAEKKSIASPSYFNYFNVAMVAYFFSLVATLVAMIMYEAAQPALLYIVPFLIITSGSMAYLKGDLNDLLEFEVAGAETEFSVQSMIERLTDGDGNPKQALTEEDIAFLKEALAFEEKKAEESKKEK